MNEKYAALRANVGMLGQLLGKSIKDHQGQAFLDKIETIRQLAKSSRKGNEIRPGTPARDPAYPLR
jgi:phosphoenolpyruvate carboxylase